jgi:hypothetical protein
MGYTFNDVPMAINKSACISHPSSSVACPKKMISGLIGLPHHRGPQILDRIRLPSLDAGVPAPAPLHALQVLRRDAALERVDVLGIHTQELPALLERLEGIMRV